MHVFCSCTVLYCMSLGPIDQSMRHFCARVFFGLLPGTIHHTTLAQIFVGNFLTYFVPYYSNFYRPQRPWWRLAALTNSLVLLISH